MKAQTNHPELNVFRGEGGLFDVSDAEMEKNIGRRVRYLNPTCGVEHEIHTITELQKNWRGEIIYRGLSESDVHKFGRPISPDEIEFVD